MSQPDGGVWLPNPKDGTSVAGGFDGSLNDDWTAIKLETREGHLFTPRYGPDRRPTIWNPAEWNGTIPRLQVTVAWAEIQARYSLRRVYCDPGFHDETSWESDIEDWAKEWGDKVFVPWPTTSIQRMYPAIRRFEADLKQVTHDGCPITSSHMRNARKIPVRRGSGYTLGKPSNHQKIDAAVTSILAHEAAADQRADGWPDDGPTIFFLPR
jgi:phage terminase large subunit-like protein